MILKALCDYYRRCKDLAPAGMEYKEIGFLIVIDKEGNFVRLEDRRTDKKSCQKFLVAKSVGRTSAPSPNLFVGQQFIFAELFGSKRSRRNAPFKIRI